MSVYIDNNLYQCYAFSMEKERLIKTIHKAGLSEKAAAVYVTLLTEDGAFPSHIAKQTKIKRSTVYDILLELSIKGLVSELKKRNKSFYVVENPKRLIRLGEKKIINAKEDQQILQDIFPEIEGLYSGVTNRPKVSYFEGVEGVMSIYGDHLATKTKYEMLGFVNVAELMEFLPLKDYREYVKAKEKIGITTRGIIPDTKEDRSYEKTVYLTAKKKIIPTVRYIPKADFNWKADLTIYDKNKVSVVTFDKERITGIIIENETIYGMMKMIFELAWKGAGK